MDASEIALLSEVEDNHWWYTERRRKLAKWAVENLKPGSRILDVGSAAGRQIELLAGLGFEVEGLEYSEVGFEIQKYKKIKVTQGSATNLPWSEYSFDAVICMDVLEHIEDDQVALNEVIRVLKHGGKFLVSVPNDPKLWSSHDLSVGHHRRYSMQSLRLLFEQSEGKIMHLENWNILLKPTLRFLRKFSNGSDLHKPSKVQNIICTLILRFEERFVSTNLSGVSLWCSGEKTKN
jgi:SAM-dependent methyltransferase